MTPQEKEMIGGLIDRVQKTQLPDKDLEAEQFLQGGLGSNRDSLYILSQTVLVQQYALDQAQKQLADLKAQLDQARQQPPTEPKHTSFLGSIFGSHGDDKDGKTDRQPPTQGGRGVQPTTPYTPVPNYAPPPPGYGQSGYGQPGYGQPGYGQGYPPQPGGLGQPQGGGFLRGAMQTAAGVAAGALAFQGVESLLHGFGGYESGGFSGGENGRPEVINNYYGDSDRGSDSRGFADDNSQSPLATEAGNNDIDADRFAGSSADSSDDFNSSSDDLAGSDDSASLDDNLDDGGDSFSDDSFGGGDDSSFS